MESQHQERRPVGYEHRYHGQQDPYPAGGHGQRAHLAGGCGISADYRVSGDLVIVAIEIKYETPSALGSVRQPVAGDDDAV